MNCWKDDGGAKGDRTPDLGIANAALSQLSYRPFQEGEALLEGGFCAVKAVACAPTRQPLHPGETKPGAT